MLLELRFAVSTKPRKQNMAACGVYNLVTMKRIACFAAVFCFSGILPAQVPAGWKTTIEPSGTCQISYPPNWKVQNDGQAIPPGGVEALVVRGSPSALQPMDPSMQKMLLVDRMFVNTAQEVFYVGKPSAGEVTYIADIQGKPKRCTAQIRVKTGYPEDEIKKIMATVREK